MSKQQPTKGRLAVILGTILVLTLLNLVFGLAWPPFLVEAGPTLPPREPPPSAPPPAGEPEDDDGERDGEPPGAYIELQVQGKSGPLWSYVEWQDSAGGWQPVDGWQGPANGGRRWWVAAKDFDTGPFRWTVAQGSGGPVLGTSELFNLPSQANQTVYVVVVVE